MLITTADWTLSIPCLYTFLFLQNNNIIDLQFFFITHPIHGTPSFPVSLYRRVGGVISYLVGGSPSILSIYFGLLSLTRPSLHLCGLFYFFKGRGSAYGNVRLAMGSAYGSLVSMRNRLPRGEN
jgi:hypothetical protein